MSNSNPALTSQEPPAANTATADKAIGAESLAPQSTRIMGRTSYFLAWFGGCVSIGTFAMGSSVVGTLNLLQATLAIAIGCFVIHADLGFRAAADQGQGGFPITPLGNDGAVARE
ncbi:hypothetical protein HHSLTHF2_29350 [Vreelandella venusta]|jgi:NCS1 family nucleobase:cation symporter-1|uniref:Cytosine permease n=1 Tax=Halomonas hydrothermalis TaxID=115561 RepID=A0A6F8U806_9GAMM|nr:cytosine permease [Halomonas hydrothermalis]BCB09045.1 hypothetical protein HHSLTHF2_29350 [Halomonas hydrothermalis]